MKEPLKIQTERVDDIPLPTFTHGAYEDRRATGQVPASSWQ